MGVESSHVPVKLVLPVLFSDESLMSGAVSAFTAEYGEPDVVVEPFVFDYTHYYDAEMGLPIYRAFFAYRHLIYPEELVSVKKFSNNVEKMFAAEGKRKVNLDPGYLTEAKFVLATTKDQQHRLYIGEGIYEELTLYYQDKEWKAWPWTYPDYAGARYREVMAQIRARYVSQLKSGEGYPGGRSDCLDRR